jgi:hypothetical protein
LEALADEAFSALGMAARVGSAGRAAAAPLDAAAALVREGDAWAMTFGGRTVRIRHAKGIADLAVLLGRPGREVHVRELAGVPAEPRGRASEPVLDATAVARYRARLTDLESDVEEADRHGDLGRAAAYRAERDALVAELTAAFGLGGRPRAAGPDPDERLRKAVSARVKAGIDRLESLHAPLGRHLRNSVRTGVWCCYAPERAIKWRIRP